MFDLLMRPGPELSAEEERQVKGVARELLATLKREALVLEWRRKQAARSKVWVRIADGLDQLPAKYDKPLYEEKCAAVYQHVFESYMGEGRSIYGVQ